MWRNIQPDTIVDEMAIPGGEDDIRTTMKRIIKKLDRWSEWNTRDDGDLVRREKTAPMRKVTEFDSSVHESGNLRR